MAIRGLVLELFFVICSSSLPVGQVVADNYHSLHQRAQDVLNSVEDEVNDLFDLNQLPNRTEIIKSATEYIAGTLGAYYSIPRSVIDTVRPGPLPYGKTAPYYHNKPLDYCLSLPRAVSTYCK